MAGIFGDFSGLRFTRNGGTRTPQKFRGKFGAKLGAKFGRKFEKFGELSFCDFSDLTRTEFCLNDSKFPSKNLRFCDKIKKVHPNLQQDGDDEDMDQHHLVPTDPDAPPLLPLTRHEVCHAISVPYPKNHFRVFF